MKKTKPTAKDLLASNANVNRLQLSKGLKLIRDLERNGMKPDTYSLSTTKMYISSHPERMQESFFDSTEEVSFSSF